MSSTLTAAVRLDDRRGSCQAEINIELFPLGLVRGLPSTRVGAEVHEPCHVVISQSCIAPGSGRCGRKRARAPDPTAGAGAAARPNPCRTVERVVRRGGSSRSRGLVREPQEQGCEIRRCRRRRWGQVLGAVACHRALRWRGQRRRGCGARPELPRPGRGLQEKKRNEEK